MSEDARAEAERIIAGEVNRAWLRNPAGDRKEALTAVLAAAIELFDGIRQLPAPREGRRALDVPVGACIDLDYALNKLRANQPKEVQS